MMERDREVQTPEKMCCAREQTAREILAEHINMLQETVQQLQSLLGALPAELPWRADRALKRILRPDKF